MIPLLFAYVCNHKEKTKQITNFFQEILAICFFGALLVCLSVNDKTKTKSHE